jgi:type I restriction enzyme S subunit
MTLPRGWAETDIREVLSVEYGAALPAAKRSGGPIPVYGSSGIVGWHDEALVDGPHLIVGRKGNAGACHVSLGSSWPIDTTYFLRVPDALNAKFIGLQLTESRLRQFDSSTAVPSLRRHDLERQLLRIAPLSEQRRILAAIEEHLSRLDMAEQTLRRAVTRINLLRERVVDRLAEHGALLRFEDCLAEPLVNGRSVPTKPDGFPVLRLSALRDGYIDLSERKLGAWSREAAMPFLVREGDFFVARGNGSLRLVGRGGLVQTEPDEIAFPDTLIRVRVNRDRVTPEYLRLVWDSKAIRDQIERTARTTAGIYKVNQQDLRSIELRLPNVAEQESLAAEASRDRATADALAAAIATALLRARSLRRSVLACAFRGELVPQDPSEEPASVLLERIAGERATAPGLIRRRRERTPA